MFCRKSRIRIVPERYIFLISEQRNVLLIEVDEATTYEESSNSSKFDKWFIAMKSKMDSMNVDQVWTSVDPLKQIKPIGYKLIFKMKTNLEGNVITYKVRFVAKGYHQRQGVDYDETFSPIAMLKSIRILIALIAHYDYQI